MGFWFFQKKEDHLHKKIADLEKAMLHSFGNVKKDMQNTGQWIGHLKEKHGHHESKFEQFEKRLVDLEEKIGQLALLIREDEEIGDERSNAFEPVQTFKRSVQTFMNVQTLTPAQKQVILLLLGAGGPMDYESLAQKLNINTITIKRHILDIKKSGFPLEEKVSVQTRRKVFTLSEDSKRMLLKQKVRGHGSQQAKR